ncbi:TolC family protein [Desulfobacterales bacterium HSG16]|nr:TolC family protein [Desulfobacterales bacterium HSG16]
MKKYFFIGLLVQLIAISYVAPVLLCKEPFNNKPYTVNKSCVEKLKLTLEECLNIAYEQNPQFLSYFQNLKIYREKEKKAYRNMFPVLSLSWSASEYLNERDDSYNTTLSLKQPLSQGNNLFIRWEMSKMDSKNASFEFRRQFQSTTFNVKSAWFRLLEANELKIETQNALKRLHKHVSNAQHFFKEGWIWRTDILQAELELAQGKNNLISAENDLALAMSRLNVLLHKNVDTRIEPLETLSWRPCLLSYDEAKKNVLSNRMDLLKAKLVVDKNLSSLDLAKTSYWPTLQVEITTSRRGDSLSIKGGQSDQRISLSSNWSLWEWNKTKTDITAAKAEIRRSRLLLSNLEDQLMLEVQEAWLAVQEADQRLTILKKTFAQSEENFRVNKIRYQERLGTAKDVLDAQDLLTRTRKDYTMATASYLISLARLNYAVGKDM